MSGHKKTWILVRGCQYVPGGSISLGQILVKPFDPSLPLLLDGPLKIPETAIERTHQTSVEVSSHSSLGGSFKIWADIDILPIKSELGAKHHTSKSTTWHFDRLDSEVMIPHLQDVQAAIVREEVVAQINRNKFNFRKRLYMITGIRIARGAKLQQKSSMSMGANAKVGVDLAALGVAPTTVGPAVDVTSTNSENHSFKNSSDFVYAYRVCEIHYGKDVYVKPFNKGETFGVHKDAKADKVSDEESEEEEELQRIVVEDMATDYTGSGVPHQSFKLPVEESDNEASNEDELILADE